jgi:hypothetical protein
MFQYALYRELRKRGLDATLDIDYFRHNTLAHGGGGYQLPYVFGINAETTQESQLKRLGMLSCRSKAYRARREMIFRFDRAGLTRRHYLKWNESGHVFDEDMFERIVSGRYAYVQGYWQNERWFGSCHEEIARDFVFRRELDEENAGCVKRITGTGAGARTVAVHIRKYNVEPGFEGLADPVLDYYRKALEQVRACWSDIRVFVFSNDIAWAREHLDAGAGAEYVDWNAAPEKQYIDMQLMSYCDCCITAYSSYSWWGAWLNPLRKEKTVFAPKGAGGYPENGVPDGWILV